MIDSLLRQWWLQSPRTLVRADLGKPKRTLGLSRHVCKSIRLHFVFCI